MSDRWALPDRSAAFDRCASRNTQDIRCVIDVMGEDIDSAEKAEAFVIDYQQVLEEIDRRRLDVSISVKPTALGAMFDRGLAHENLLRICGKASSLGIGFEIDMEGTPLVDHTIDGAIACSLLGAPVMLALQAYLDRTEEDLERVIDAGIEVRLVKGAYLGDVRDFKAVQRRFVDIVDRLRDAGVPFCVGTHDPEMVRYVTGLGIPEDRIEFGFLMGLGEETKVELTREGWQVSEYVPYGDDVRAYELRRERYLKNIEAIGREPVR